jgi:hypothetical protein
VGCDPACVRWRCSFAAPRTPRRRPVSASSPRSSATASPCAGRVRPGCSKTARGCPPATAGLRDDGHPAGQAACPRVRGGPVARAGRPVVGAGWRPDRRPAAAPLQPDAQPAPAGAGGGGQTYSRQARHRRVADDAAPGARLADPVGCARTLLARVVDQAPASQPSLGCCLMPLPPAGRCTSTCHPSSTNYR